MKLSILSILMAFCFSFLQAQKLNHFSIEANYGLNGNFFVRSYDETGPSQGAFCYKKNFIGSIGGLAVKYNFSNNSSLSLGYDRSVNKREITYDMGGNATILYFNISHINQFYELAYEKSFSKKNQNFKFNGGLFYLRMNQQEIDISPFRASFEERDYKHYKLAEGGIFLGFHYTKKIDTKFELGLKSRVYYLISTSSFEAITLTPTLTYFFKP